MIMNYRGVVLNFSYSLEFTLSMSENDVLVIVKSYSTVFALTQVYLWS